MLSGLRDLGYTVFVVDEPCFVGRNKNGSLIENTTTWPRGLKAFGDYLHARREKKRRRVHFLIEKKNFAYFFVVEE